METRRIGASDLEAPVVSFGAWAIGGWLWGGTDDADAVRAIQRALDVGITCIDTAPVYGMGHSESVVGRAIAGRRDEVLVATKCGLRWDCEDGPFYFKTQTPDGVPVRIHRNLRPDSIKRECEQSLKRLGVDRIDLYQCHWPDVSTPLADTMGALTELLDEGKIRAIGVSNFTPDMMRECLEYAPIASDQPLYNALERGIEADVLPFCIENRVGVLPYSPIAQGLLTGKVTPDRQFAPGDHRAQKPWFRPDNRRRVLDMLERIRPIADGHGATLGQVMINWTFSQKGITSVLVGARNERQVEENAGAAAFRLSDDELRTIRDHVEALGGPV